MTGEEMEAAWAGMSQPSRAYLFLVEDTPAIRQQLTDVIGAGYFIRPDDKDTGLVAVYVKEAAVPLAMLIFADCPIWGGQQPKPLTVWEEHQYVKKNGLWPWVDE